MTGYEEKDIDLPASAAARGIPTDPIPGGSVVPRACTRCSAVQAPFDDFYCAACQTNLLSLKVFSYLVATNVPEHLPEVANVKQVLWNRQGH